ncbi:unnamed protein product [Hymenolepis diminuta]|uniref:FHA domain-containing protein n=1 Tax=Hymenolepis diminuta TaxID=6216 RepID=A0A564YBD4_HYMDI|nr:unnamed protein product [Hymenolepis diminuta]
MEKVEHKAEVNELNKGPSSEADTNSEPEKFLFKASPLNLPAKPERSTAKVISETQPPIDTSKYYKPPEWAQTCPSESNYFIEVIKNGTSLPDDTIHLAGVNHCVLGRQPALLLNPNFVGGKTSPLLHPSISRAHAVLQYGCYADSTPGWYLFDFDSTHGTFVNKHRVPPGRYIRLRVGYVLRFGSSTRLLILNGPEDDMEEETKESFSELIVKRKAKLAKIERNEGELKQLAEKSVTGGGGNDGPCNWGISDDVEEEDNGEIMLQRLAGSGNCLSHEKNYIEDPKKTLKSFFDREGLDPEYEFVEGKFGQQICRIELPLEEGTVYAEVPLTGRKKKEAIAACALEACRMLDRLGQFDANREGAEAVRRAREKAYWQENDYYSSDEDTFLDRTGQIEVRRRQRMRRLGVDDASLKQDESTSRKVDEEQQDSFTLLANLEELGKEMIKVEDELNAAERALEAAGENASEMDELEAYMEAIKNGAPKRAERQALKQRLVSLRQEEVRLLRRAGIRITPVRFSSAASSSAVSAAVRATLTNASIDKVDTNKPDSGHVESKLNALKRQLPKVAVAAVSEQKRSIDGEDEPFVPEVDEDEEEESTDTAKPELIKAADKSEEASEGKPTQKQPSSSEPEEPSGKKPKHEKRSEVLTKDKSIGNSAPSKVCAPLLYCFL